MTVRKGIFYWLITYAIQLVAQLGMALVLYLLGVDRLVVLVVSSAFGTTFYLAALFNLFRMVWRSKLAAEQVRR